MVGCGGCCARRGPAVRVRAQSGEWRAAQLPVSCEARSSTYSTGTVRPVFRSVATSLQISGGVNGRRSARRGRRTGRRRLVWLLLLGRAGACSGTAERHDARARCARRAVPPRRVPRIPRARQPNQRRQQDQETYLGRQSLPCVPVCSPGRRRGRSHCGEDGRVSAMPGRGSRPSQGGGD